MIEKIKPLLVKLLFPVFYLISIIQHKMFPIQIRTDLETIESLSKGMSVSRLGDLEFYLILGRHGLSTQDMDNAISGRLQEILSLDTEKTNGFMIALAHGFGNYNDQNFREISFWSWYNARYRNKIYPYLNSKVYLNAHFARNFKKQEEVVRAMKEIWRDKQVLLVEGEKIKFGLHTNILDNAKSIKRIIAPAKNAWSCYNDIVNAVKKHEKNHLILIILGATATVLAYDLWAEGYHAIDFGQGIFWMEHEQTGTLLSEDDYCKQIVAVIKLNKGD